MNVDDDPSSDGRVTSTLAVEAESPTTAKRELSEENEEDATPPPPTERPPEVKRRRFFGNNSEDDHKSSASDDVKTEDDGGLAVDGKVDKGKGRAATGPEVVEILDDSEDDDEIIEAGPSSERNMNVTPKDRVARNGKDFKDQKYFGSESAIARLVRYDCCRD